MDSDLKNMSRAEGIAAVMDAYVTVAAIAEIQRGGDLDVCRSAMRVLWELYTNEKIPQQHRNVCEMALDEFFALEGDMGASATRLRDGIRSKLHPTLGALWWEHIGKHIKERKEVLVSAAKTEMELRQAKAKL